MKTLKKAKGNHGETIIEPAERVPRRAPRGTSCPHMLSRCCVDIHYSAWCEYHHGGGVSWPIRSRLGGMLGVFRGTTVDEHNLFFSTSF